MTPKHTALIWLAEMFVGVTEKTPNAGTMIERFQRAVDGVAAGEPWCVCFVQHCAREVDMLMDMLVERSSERPSGEGLVELIAPRLSRHNVLPATEWTVALWGAPAAARSDDPKPGTIVVWRSLANPARGHCGIVCEVLDDRSILTIEGNTSPGEGADQREGDGVWKKRRKAGNINGFLRLGYVNPWP